MLVDLDNWANGRRELPPASAPLAGMAQPIDLERFMGRWYVLANIPTIFDRGTINNMEDYAWDAERQTITSTFTYQRSAAARPDSVRQRCTLKNEAKTEWVFSQKVGLFYIPLGTPYLILDCAGDYSTCIIGVPDRSYLWIMTRTKGAVDDGLKDSLLKKAIGFGFEARKIVTVPQEWDPLPRPLSSREGSFGKNFTKRLFKKRTTNATNESQIFNFMATHQGRQEGSLSQLAPFDAEYKIIDTKGLEQSDFEVDFGDLEMGTKIASGAGGSVSKGRYRGKICAIKELHTAFGTSSIHLELLKRETTLLAKLRHPSLLQFFGFCLHSSRFYIVMDYCPMSMEARLRNGHYFEGSALVTYLSQFQQAIQYLHQNNVLHRDLKPANILFDQNDDLKVIDFGLARENTTGEPVGKFTQAVGTPFYMAPELFSLTTISRGETTKKYGVSVDIYSWGIIAWQFFTSNLSPFIEFEQGSIFAFMDAVRRGHRPPMDGIPPVGKEMIQRCVHQDPLKRYSAVELAKYLQHPSLLDMVFRIPPEGALSDVAVTGGDETASHQPSSLPNSLRLRFSIHSDCD